MSIVRAKGVYEKSSKCKFVREQSQYLPCISGYTASLLYYSLHSPFYSLIVGTIKSLSNFRVVSYLELEEAPTEYPLIAPEKITLPEPFELDSLGIEKANWPFFTVNDFHKAYLAGKTTPSKIADKILKLCELEEIRALGAIAEIRKEEVIKAAEESSARFAGGNPLSVVDGVPFFVKEHICIKNYTSFEGSEACPRVADLTAHCVQKLLERGALLIGTTTMTQLGSNPIGINPSLRFPSPRNPWDTTRYAGGSSSGSAIVVAIGLCPFAIGSDAVGSIRVPSGFNGIVGLRSTFCRVSLRLCYSMTGFNPNLVVGPMACCVTDAALMYHIMSGPDEQYEQSLLQPPIRPPNFADFKLSNVKFGVFWDYIKQANTSLVNCFNEFCDKLRDNGCSIQDILIPEIHETTICCITGQLHRMKRDIYTLEKTRKILDASTDINLLFASVYGSQVTEKEASTVMKQRTRAIDIMKQIFETTDIVLLLTTCSTAPIIEPHHKSRGVVDLQMLMDSLYYIGISSLTGLPALCLNIGYEPETNLPISLQMMASWWHEDLLLSVGNSLEQLFPLNKRPELWQPLFDS